MIEFKEGDIETIDLPSAAFVTVLCRWGSGQKFGRLITRGKITDVSRVEELSESLAFYDAEMISELMNTMLRHINNIAINRGTAGEVSNIMNQLRAV